MRKQLLRFTINCGTCKHWQPVWTGTQFDWDANAGCIPDEDVKEWGWCRKITMPEMFEQVPEGTKAFTKDGSDYRADLHTRSDFGCVLAEPES